MVKLFPLQAVQADGDLNARDHIIFAVTALSVKFYFRLSLILSKK